MTGHELENEIKLIQNEEIRNFITFCVSKLPEYFFHVPASSSGKYHPTYCLGEGGLLRHTKAAVYFAKELLFLESSPFTLDQKDTIIGALILHDGWKKGLIESSHTVSEHPVIASEQIKKLAIEKGLTSSKIDDISMLVLTHMGQWNRDAKTNQVLMPKPISAAQRFVHLCDYLASRKKLEVQLV